MSDDHVFGKGNLRSQFDELYRDLRRWHSTVLGKPDQKILRTPARNIPEGYEILVGILPLGVEIAYTLERGDGRVDEKHGLIARVDERVTISAPATIDSTIGNSFIVPEKEADSFVSEDEPLLENVYNMSPSDMRRVMERAYRSAVRNSVNDMMLKKGQMLLGADISIPGVEYKLSLANVQRFDGAEGMPTLSDLERMMLPVLQESFPKISHDDYDNFFILDRSLCIDWNGKSVVGAITKYRMSGRDDSLRSLLMASYEKSKSNLFVYSHDDNVVALVDNVFPDLGSVYVYVKDDERNRGLVAELFDHYVFDPKQRAAVLPGQIVLPARGLTISFIGPLADSEFNEQKMRYAAQREDREAEDAMADILD